jgi:predicted RNase H-like HicB family nuclease
MLNLVDHFVRAGWCHIVRTDEGFPMQKQFKVVIEKHTDGYIAYPLGLKGVVVGEGDTYEEALIDVKSAIRFHIETFGQDAFQNDDAVLEVFVAETKVAI